MNLPVTRPPSEGELAIPEKLKQTLMRTVFRGLNEDEATVAYRLAHRRGLDVEAKQIFFVPYTAKDGSRSVVSQTSIDGLRLIASKSGHYGGSVNPKLTVRLRDGAKRVINHEEYDPDEVGSIISATISVINKDFPQPQTATALLKSYSKTYNNQLSGLWRTMPDVMLLKCAEALALRKAFPQDLGGLYSNEEMDQAKNDLDAVNVSFSAVQPSKPPVTTPISLPPAASAQQKAGTPKPPIIDVPTDPVTECAAGEAFKEIDQEKFQNTVWARFSRYVGKKSKDPALAIEMIKKAACERFDIEDPANISPADDATLTLYLKTIGLPTLEKNGLA